MTRKMRMIAIVSQTLVIQKSYSKENEKIRNSLEWKKVNGRLLTEFMKKKKIKIVGM